VSNKNDWSRQPSNPDQSDFDRRSSQSWLDVHMTLKNSQICQIFERDWMETIMRRARFSFTMNPVDVLTQVCCSHIQHTICQQLLSSLSPPVSTIAVLIFVSKECQPPWAPQLRQSISFSLLVWLVSQEWEFVIASSASSIMIGVLLELSRVTTNDFGCFIYLWTFSVCRFRFGAIRFSISKVSLVGTPG
jgi:hypothetical protein